MATERAKVNTTRRVKLTNVRANGTRVTSLGGGESITWQMTTSPEVGEGTVIDSGSGTYESNQRYWYDDTTMPATPQTLFVHWTVVKSGATERFMSVIRVTR